MKCLISLTPSGRLLQEPTAFSVPLLWLTFSFLSISAVTLDVMEHRRRLLAAPHSALMIQDLLSGTYEIK